VHFRPFAGPARLADVDPTLPELVERALAEDVGTGDITARAIVPHDAGASARIVQKQA
jgi:nicotinate-nucleotide pyrophosphorylase